MSCALSAPEQQQPCKLQTKTNQTLFTATNYRTINNTPSKKPSKHHKATVKNNQDNIMTCKHNDFKY